MSSLEVTILAVRWHTQIQITLNKGNMNQNPRYSADVCSPVPHWTIQFLKQKASTFSLLSFPLIWRWNSIPVHALNYSPTLVSTGNEAQTRTLSHQNNYSVIIPNHTTPPPTFYKYISPMLCIFVTCSHTLPPSRRFLSPAGADWAPVLTVISHLSLHTRQL